MADGSEPSRARRGSSEWFGRRFGSSVITGELRSPERLRSDGGMVVGSELGSEIEAALEDARDERERFERLAASDLPYAPYARRVLNRLDRAEYDGE